MDHAGGLRALHALQNGPGARFLGPHGEIGNQPKQRITRADHAIQPAFFQAKGRQELPTISLRHLADFRFNRGGYHHRLRAFGLGAFKHAGGLRIARGSGSFFHIADIKHGLCRQ